MTIQTRFNIGDEVYFHHAAPLPLGQNLKKEYITGVEIECSGDSLTIMYVLNGGYRRYETDCFKTETEFMTNTKILDMKEIAEIPGIRGLEIRIRKIASGIAQGYTHVESFTCILDIQLALSNALQELEMITEKFD